MYTVLVINPYQEKGREQCVANLGMFPNKIETEVEESRVINFEVTYNTKFPEDGKLIVDLREGQEPSSPPVDPSSEGDPVAVETEIEIEIEQDGAE